jgi:hypothetical protein
MIKEDKKAYCKICEKERVFIQCINPDDYFICGTCGFRTDFGKYRLVWDQFGVHFEIVEKEVIYLMEKGNSSKGGLKEISKSEGIKKGLYPISVPGKCVNHSHWRFGVAHTEECNELRYFTLEMNKEDKIGEEGAVRVIWWIEKKKKRIK